MTPLKGAAAKPSLPRGTYECTTYSGTRGCIFHFEGEGAVGQIAIISAAFVLTLGVGTLVRGMAAGRAAVC